MNDIEKAIDVQQKLIKKWENRAKELEEVIKKYPWEKMGYESADWRETELKRRKEQIKIALITISALEKQLNGGWIPVSERLPKENEEVLITLTHGQVTWAYLYQGKWHTMFSAYPIDGVVTIGLSIIFKRVIAWQPLPEPYKEEENE